MTTTEDRSSSVSGAPGAAIMDTPLEVLVVPVSDVDRAKAFYASMGWRLDADRAADEFRLVQFTPPGSGCSVPFGKNLTTAPPGSAQGMMLTVSDIQAAREALVNHGVQVSEVFHCATGTACRFRDGDGVFERVSGPEPDHTSYSSFVSFSDLASAMIRAAVAHGEHEKRIGHADADWPHWYAEYMVAEQAGAELPR